MAAGSHRDKVLFRLAKDDTGYPPVEYESLWALRASSDTWTIDKISFFVRDISLGDEVRAIEAEGERWFESVVKRSARNVIGIISLDQVIRSEVLEECVRRGCSWEGHLKRLVAVDVPPEASLDAICQYLARQEGAGLLEYEEASIRP